MTRVLVIDDDQQDRQLIIRRLLKSCESVIPLEASRLSDGLEVARENAVDIVMLDLTLAESEGIDTLRRFLRAESHVPVVVLTGSSDANLELQAIEAGAQDFIRKSDIGNPWLENCLHHAMARHELQYELRHRSMTDALTCLPNREAFEHRLKARIESQDPTSGNQYAVVFIDLNEFKSINDTYGHAAGDAVLKEFAWRSRYCSRTFDFTARFGGDEFVVLLESVRSSKDVEKYSKRLTEALNNPIDFEGAQIEISASIGYVISNSKNMSVPEILRDADAAMYKAKRASIDRRNPIIPTHGSSVMGSMQSHVDSQI